MYVSHDTKTMERQMRDYQEGEMRPWAEWLEELVKAWDQNQDERLIDGAQMLLRYGEGRGYEQVHKNKLVQARYVALRLDGQGHNLAAMFATGQTPGIMTDSVFLEGHCNGNQFDGHEGLADEYARIARAHGVDPKGKVYIGGLASFPGDPLAWVADRHDVQKVCELKGFSAQGAVNYTAGPRDPAPDVDVADDLVEARMRQRVEKDPSLALKDRGELRHETKEAMKPHWSE